jgi:transcriptional regulator with XRE-family HTH domain
MTGRLSNDGSDHYDPSTSGFGVMTSNAPYRVYDDAFLASGVCLLASFLPAELNAWEGPDDLAEPGMSQGWDILSTGQDTQTTLPEDVGQSASQTGEEPEHADTSPSKAIRTTKLRSGLTWELLATVFGVSRQTLHSWAKGEAPSAANEWKIHRVHAAIRSIDRGSPSVNRSVLLSELKGISPIRLLTEGRFAEAVDHAGEGSGRSRASGPRLSEEEKALRAPLPPETLLEGGQSGGLQTRGNGRAITMHVTRS